MKEFNLEEFKQIAHEFRSRTLEECQQEYDNICEQICSWATNQIRHRDTLEKTIAILKEANAGLADKLTKTSEALESSVRLQAHYGKLLNMHDGGERIVFNSASEWMQRLEQMKHATKENETPNSKI